MASILTVPPPQRCALHTNRASADHSTYLMRGLALQVARIRRRPRRPGARSELPGAFEGRRSVRLYTDEPHSRHPLQPPGPDYRFVEPPELNLPELPEKAEDFDWEEDDKWDAILEAPWPAMTVPEHRTVNEINDSRKSWRERWRDRYKRNCASSSTLPLALRVILA